MLKQNSLPVLMACELSIHGFTKDSEAWEMNLFLSYWLIANTEISLLPVRWCVKCGWSTILCMCSVRNQSNNKLLIKQTILNLPTVLITCELWNHNFTKKMKHEKQSSLFHWFKISQKKSTIKNKTFLKL